MGFKDWVRAQLRRRRVRRHLRKDPSTTPFGFKFVGTKAMREGTFEPAETKVLRHLFAQANLFVNVGANFGYFACMARHLGVRTVAVEPVPINAETLRRNKELNGWSDNFVIHQAACGTNPGSAEIFGEGTGASFVDGWAGNPNALRHTVKVERLDVLLNSEKVNDLTVFLVDVEGFEMEVLNGSTAIFEAKQRPIWMLESGLFDHRPGNELNTGFQDVMSFLEARNYRVFNALDLSQEVTSEIVSSQIAQGVDRLGTHNFVLVPAETDMNRLSPLL